MQTPAKHKAEDEYLLTTKLFCGKCQCYMVGESGTSKTSHVHRYYKCASVKNHKGCDKKSVKKEWIENLVIEQIKKLIFDDDLIEKIADKAMVLQGKENTTLPLLKKQYADTQKSIDNMLDAIQQGIPVGFGCFLFRLYLFGFLLLLGKNEVSAFKMLLSRQLL